MISTSESDIEATSLKSFSTEDSGISSCESFSKHLKKAEDPKAIEKFSVLLKRVKKLEKLLEIMLTETSINSKIKRYFSLEEEDIKQLRDSNLKEMSFLKNGKINKIQLISNYVDSHKNCLLDFCLLELYKIINDFLIVKKLDNSRLLFLQRKLNKCQKTIFQIMELKKLPSK